MSVVSIIGKTPVSRLDKIASGKVEVWAKLEGANPGGSVKDRPALAMIIRAEEQGLLGEGRVILEPTSGNTGIGLAMVAAARGYRLKLCMPECVSSERRAVLLALGAELELTPGAERTDGAIRRARRIAEEQPDLYYMPDQFSNDSNWRAHYQSTAPEIYEQMGGELDCFVAGMGTTGTLMGCSRWFREHAPHVKVIGVEPVLGHAIQGLKNMKESIVPAIYDPALLDGVVTVEDDEAFETTRRLAIEEGLFVGMSSGAALAGALKVAGDLRSGRVCTLFPDRGDRYLSTSLFQSICAECPP